MIVIGFPEYVEQARRLAEQLEAPYCCADVHRFPDGESRVRLPASLPERVVFCRSLNQPNDKLIELLLASACARSHGARHLTLVAPYWCYLRQDEEFTPGEAVSAPVVGAFLAQHFDSVITVEAHLHRIAELRSAVPAKHAVNLSAASAMAAHIAAQVAQPLLLGPDRESQQWVAQLASIRGWDYGVADKTRHGDYRVDVALPDIDFKGRHVVLVDDMVSTGRTLAHATRALHDAGAAAVYCAFTHALFAGHADATLRAAGVAALWSTDSVTHASNAIHLAPLLAQAVRATQ